VGSQYNSFFGQRTEPLLAKRKKIVTGEEEAPPMPAGLEPVAGSGTAEGKAAEGQKVRTCCRPCADVELCLPQPHVVSCPSASERSQEYR